MASSDPTGGGAIVILALTFRQRQYLRRTLCHCKTGPEGDLQTHPDHRNAGKWRVDVAAYDRLLAGLEAGSISPDDQVRRIVRELATATDHEEEYERVVFEHAALLALGEQIGAER